MKIALIAGIVGLAGWDGCVDPPCRRGHHEIERHDELVQQYDVLQPWGSGIQGPMSVIVPDGWKKAADREVFVCDEWE